MENIFFERFKAEPLSDDKTLLRVLFKDSSGEIYCWTPKWEDARKLFDLAVDIECFNTNTQSPEVELFLQQAKVTELTCELYKAIEASNA